MLPNGIPLFPSTFPCIVSTSMTSFPSGSIYFQGLSFGSSYILPSNTSLNLGQAQNVNHLQGGQQWPSPSVTHLGARKLSHLFGQ